MRIKYLLPLAAMLLLIGCQKAPAPAAETTTPSNTETAVISESVSIETKTDLPASPEIDTAAPVLETSIPEPTAEPVTTQASTEEPGETAEATPTSPKPTEPQPADPKPSDPKPTEPKPSDPKPTEPAPSQPKPTEPAPTQPSPTQPAHTHSYKATVVAPTCTAKGYTGHKCSCGDSYKDNYTEALGHSFSEQTVAATCTSGGYTLRTCSRCKATETTNTTPALGHDYRDTVVAPTTSSQGYTEHKCVRCGDSYRDNYTDKLKEVYDLQAVIDYGCSYAQSLGFTIDRSMTLANSGYYPGYRGDGYSLDFLKQRAAGLVQYTADMLTADGDTIAGYRCYIHASYDPDTDKYYIVVLYG